MKRSPVLLVCALLATPAFAAELLRYNAPSADKARRQWPGEPGVAVGLPADALVLDGAVAFSGRGNPPALTGLGPAQNLPAREITVEAVFSLEQAGEWGGVLGFLQDNGGEESGWVLGHHKDRFTFALASKGADDGNGMMTYLDGTSAFVAGKLFHVLGTYDGAEMRLYVNGQLEARTDKQSGDILYPASSALILAGYRDSNESYALCGRVAHVSLRDSATDDSVAAAAFQAWQSACASAPVLTATMPRPPAAVVRPSVRATSPADAFVPTQQWIRPAGEQVVLAGLRPQAVAVAPDESYVVVTGRSAELILIDPSSAKVIGKVPMPSGGLHEPPAAADHILAPDPKAQVSFTGLCWSPDKRRLVLSNVAGDIKVFDVDPAGWPKPSFSIALPPVKDAERKQEIPSGLAFSPDGRKLYACGNLANQLLELDAANGSVLRTFPVGVAPYDVVVAGDRAWVSNWGGRRPAADSRTHPAGRGTFARSDERGIAEEGSVSVIDLASGELHREILTGRHACDMALSPDGRHIAVANANEDTVSVLSVERAEVVETINLAWQPDGLASASPNALAFSPNGPKLLVCNGAQNTLAVINFSAGSSEVSGLIPTGWYPGALAVLPRAGMVAVANIKGLGSGAADQLAGKASSNSHRHTGSVSFIRFTDAAGLKAHTRAAMENTKRAVLDAALLPPRPGVAPRPVPERAGEPSTIKHVVYIIKENRTYDQVLGDLPEGRGDPFLCVFGEEITPNQHKICREFVLLDNTHCCGVLSADGHQWSTAGYVTDYLEKSFAGFPRSYPDFCGIEDHDTLAYSPSGFLWDAALKKNLWVRNFGESSAFNKAVWMDPGRKGKPGFLDCVNDWKDGMTQIDYQTGAGLDSLKEHTATNFVGWLTHVPDVVRAELFLRELKQWEEKGDMPALSVMVLPQDHTNGTSPGQPTPAACVADNDLAVGRVVESLSHSRFWKDLAIFIIEDDPQAGWDHVSPYRTTAYVVSPWCKRGAVVSELYSQTSLLRTMELILGLPPMNLLDAIATPMTACFADKPDLTPFKAVPNNIPIEQMNGQASLITDPILREDALVSSRLPLDRVDACPEDVFNRILWRAMKGTAAPYPEWASFPEDMLEEDDDD